MKAILAAFILAAVAATPAAAKHKRHHHTYWQNSYAHTGYGGPGVLYGSSPRYWQPDPYGVYVGGYHVGRDPDPNVRHMLERDYNYIYGWR